MKDSVDCGCQDCERDRRIKLAELEQWNEILLRVLNDKGILTDEDILGMADVVKRILAESHTESVDAAQPAPQQPDPIIQSAKSD